MLGIVVLLGRPLMYLSTMLMLMMMLMMMLLMMLLMMMLRTGAGSLLQKSALPPSIIN